MLWLLVLVTATLPVGLRLLLGSAIPGLHEYEAFFFYASDIAVLILIWAAWRHHRTRLRELYREHGGVLLIIMLIAGSAAAITAPAPGLALYALLRLAVLIAFAFSLGGVANREKLFQTIALTIAIVAVIEASVGLAQFKHQGSVGLQLFGEPVLVSYTGAASTLHVEDGRFLRVYGTFPHPNILAAFLSLGILALAYWYVWCERKIAKLIFNHPRDWWRMRGHVLKALNSYITSNYFYLRLLIAAGLFIVMLGLVLTFSRSGWLATTIGVALFALALVKYFPGAVVRMVLMVAACAFVAVTLFKPLVLPRTQLRFTEPAVDERLLYNDLGSEVAINNPGGVGPGNQVLYSVDNQLYQERGLHNVWKWEPIHNLYLLMTTEIGWLGVLSFLVFLGMVVLRLVRSVTLEKALALSLVAGLVTAGMFDHFLWTLQPGRMMLWLAIGLALSQLPIRKQG